jgi:hypothetical protein
MIDGGKVNLPAKAKFSDKRLVFIRIGPPAWRILIIKISAF